MYGGESETDRDRDKDRDRDRHGDKDRGETAREGGRQGARARTRSRAIEGGWREGERECERATESIDWNRHTPCSSAAAETYSSGRLVPAAYHTVSDAPERTLYEEKQTDARTRARAHTQSQVYVLTARQNN